MLNSNTDYVIDTHISTDNNDTNIHQLRKTLLLMQDEKRQHNEIIGASCKNWRDIPSSLSANVY